MNFAGHILFCSNPLYPGTVDPDFDEEFEAALSAGFKTLLFDLDKFLAEGESALNKIEMAKSECKLIYRGWMMRPNQYSCLYETLLKKNYRLINSPRQYINCHYLPESLRFIHAHTVTTLFWPLHHAADVSALTEAAKAFGTKPIVIKDYVKSEKHHWESACYVEDASDEKKLKQSIQNFIALRGKELNEGIVLREFVNLHHLGNHDKSGMPLTEEYRLFFARNQLLNCYEYWEGVDYKLQRPGLDQFNDLAKKIESNFFTMDIARKTNGQLIIMELGDGQVSGIPEKADKKEFYLNLKTIFLSNENSA